MENDVLTYNGKFKGQWGRIVIDEDKLCVMCNKILNEDEESVYSFKKCYNKYAFWTISKKKTEQMKAIANNANNEEKI